MTKASPKKSPVNNEVTQKVFSYAQKAKQLSQKLSTTSDKNKNNDILLASQKNVQSLIDPSDKLKTIEKFGSNGLRLPKPIKTIDNSSSKIKFLSPEQNAAQENISKCFIISNISFGSDKSVLPKDLELNQNVIISALYSDKQAGLVPFKGVQVHIPGFLSNTKSVQNSAPLSSSQTFEKSPTSINSLFSNSKKISIDEIPEFIPRGFSSGKLSANTPSFQLKPKPVSNISPVTSKHEPFVAPNSSADTQKVALTKPILSESSISLPLSEKSDLKFGTTSSINATPIVEASASIGAISANPLASQKIESGIKPLDHIKPFVPKNFVPSSASLSVFAPAFSPLLKSINALPFTPSKPSNPVKIRDPNTKTEVVFENKILKKGTTDDNSPKSESSDSVPIENKGSEPENPNDISTNSDTESSQINSFKVIDSKNDDTSGKDCANNGDSQTYSPITEPCALESDTKISTILDQEVFSEPASHDHAGLSHSAPVSTRVSSPASSDISEPSDIKEMFDNEAESALSPTRVCYDRSFLLKFKDMCLSKPANLRDTGFMHDDANADRSYGHRSSRSSSFGGSKLKTSEERFKASTIQMRSGGSGKGSHGRSNGESNRKSHSFNNSRSNSHHNPSNSEKNNSIPLEPVEPLKPTENRWTARKADEEDKEVRINKKVKSLLNKLTLEKFDSISDQIITIANESEQEKDGETLKLVIKLVFEKATDEPNFSAVYAQLCVKMQNDLSDKITDEDIKNKDGTYCPGGLIFRKYLLTRCQQEFNKGWKDNVAAELQTDFDLMSDEYYKVAKAKRQGLGLIRFIGELFKLSMLTEGIMHGCITGMLQKEPDEEEVESIFKLMSTIGKQIDTKSSSQQMNVYFTKIGKMSQDESLPLRSRFTLKNLIDLRKNKWEQRRGEAAGPKTLQEIREAAEQEAEEKQRQEKHRRTTSSSSRNYSGSLPRERHDSRDKQRHKDGWNTVNVNSPTRGKAGDMSSFGNLSRSKSSIGSAPFSPGNSSVFNSLESLKNNSKDGSISKKPAQPSITNMFTMLDDADITPDVASRPILKLLPRSKDEGSSEQNSEHDAQKAEMIQEPESDILAKEAFSRKVINTIKEFWALGDFEEALLSIKELNTSNRNYNVVDVFISEAIERKAADVARLAELFKLTAKENIITSEDFFTGSKNIAVKLDDISLDAPAAFDHMAMLLNSYSLDLSQLLLIIESMNVEPNSFPPGPRLFSAMIKHRRISESEDALIEEFLAKQCDLTRLYHKDDQTSAALTKLAKIPALAFLLPSITSSDWWKSLIPDTL